MDTKLGGLKRKAETTPLQIQTELFEEEFENYFNISNQELDERLFELNLNINGPLRTFELLQEEAKIEVLHFQECYPEPNERPSSAVTHLFRKSPEPEPKPPTESKSLFSSEHLEKLVGDAESEREQREETRTKAIKSTESTEQSICNEERRTEAQIYQSTRDVAYRWLETRRVQGWEFDKS